MDAYEIGTGEELVEAEKLDPHRARPISSHVRVVSDEPHPEGGGALGHEGAHVAKPEDPERLAVQLDALPLGPLPPTFDEGGVGLGDVAGLREHQRDRVLRCRQDVRLRGVDDHHAATRGRGDVNVVEPHARAPDRNQVASGLEHLGCHAGRRTDDESRCTGHGLDELGWAERQLHVDLVTFGCHQLEPTRRKRLGDEDPRHRLITHFRAELSQTLDAPYEVRVRQSV